MSNARDDAPVEAVSERFGQAWQSGAPPDLSDYLRDPLWDQADARLRLLAALVPIDIEGHWRLAHQPALVGDPDTTQLTQPPTAEYYRRFLPSGESPTPVEWIVGEFRARSLWGDAPTPGEVCKRYQGREEVFHALQTAKEALTGTVDQESGSTMGDVRLAEPELATDGALELSCPACRGVSRFHFEPDLEVIDCPECGGSVSLASADGESSNATLGRFYLLNRVGRGAFGVVWKARDKQLGRVVALKIPVQSTLAPAELKKVLREARAVAKLEHKHIVTLYDVCTHDGMPVLVCRFVEGESLEDRMQRTLRTVGVMPARHAAAICADLASGLAHAHSRGVVHRDLKPSNVLMDRAGNCYIADFGLAKQYTDASTMTVEGQVLGTPAYMSPEQAQGEGLRADHRSDIYSLGAMLFELLTGERPFRGTVRMLLDQVINEPPPRPSKLNSETPADLEMIALKCLEKKPADRYQSAAELEQDLRRFLASEEVSVKPPSPWRQFRRWFPAHAAQVLGAFYMVAPLFWVFYILGEWLESHPDNALRLSSPVFLPCALGWIGLGYLVASGRPLWARVNLAAAVAFAMLALVIDDRPTSYVLIAMITTAGAVLHGLNALSRRGEQRRDGTVF